MVFPSDVQRTQARSAYPWAFPLAGAGSCSGAAGQIKIPFTLAYSFKVPIQFPPGNAEVSTPACRLFSLAYLKLPRVNCLTLFRQWIRCVFSFTLLTAVKSKAARMLMTAIVTSNSISVKARLFFVICTILDEDPRKILLRCRLFPRNYILV